MKCIILAAGYATRLHPLTENTAKPLLPVAGRPILEHILDKVEQVEEIDAVYIVTNAKFYDSFVQWAEQFAYSKPVQVLNDGTTTNDNRLGAIADLQFVIEQTRLQDDVMVLAGDNLFDMSLTDFVDYYHQVQTDCITTHELDDMEEAKRTGIIERGEDGRVLSFEEKPEHPKSHLAVPPFYIYRQETLPLIKQYLAEGQNSDAPGNFIPWLIQRKPVHAYLFEGRRYDIGTLESYERVQALFW